MVASAADLCGCRSGVQSAAMQMQLRNMVFRCGGSVLSLDMRSGSRWDLTLISMSFEHVANARGTGQEAGAEGSDQSRSGGFRSVPPLLWQSAVQFLAAQSSNVCS